MNKDIERELALVHRDHPEYLRRFQQIMHKGLISGITFRASGSPLETTDNTKEEVDCGCFYGWLTPSDPLAAIALSALYTQQLDYTRNCTPIEYLIVDVIPGETPEDSESLATLDEEIDEFFASREGVPG